MKRLSLVLPVGVMFLIGSVYAWSMFVPSLTFDYGFNAFQTQLVFGTIIATFTLSMLFSNRLQQFLSARGMYFMSAFLFGGGYFLASFSEGDFFLIFLGIGLMSGVGTGLGYMTSIALPVKWFPENKGFITGLAASGFAAGSIGLTFWAGWLLNNGIGVFAVFRLIGLIYGAIILVLALFLPRNSSRILATIKPLKLNHSLWLFVSMFFGTFAGLLVIGNIKLIGAGRFTEDQLSMAIVVFSVSNLSGRLFWGWLSDKKKVMLLLTIALLMQGFGTLMVGIMEWPLILFMIFVLFIGAGFGANFVLFAHETARVFGVSNLSRIYPFVFLGYGLAGIVGPVTGGALFDTLGNFEVASVISFVVSLMGILAFEIHRKRTKNIKLQ
ncbi:MAG: MFS transporter [Prolixibacteraceae bacterium]|nr:MFS transporter [Prolixibacteraceae bacterium]